MSTMPATHGHNVTGSTDALKGLVSVFDIFGYADQTIQGADILAIGDSQQKYQVFMPDWFDGHSCPVEWYPPDTEEKQKNLGEWFAKNSPVDVATTLVDYFKALQAASPSIQSWGIIGYCWGGKVVELVTSQALSNPFHIAAACHPAMVDPSGSDKILVPYALLASMEELPDTIKDFERRLKVPHHVETFSDQVHGFMAARADLSDPHVKAEYTRGYKVLLDFLRKQWP
ncbi:hypothetical protein FHL15_007048 [Xylaria flabelliformis]|uniref:Dienelactone hydrolase domain-containing protein n=1 Tax=Xylaria flabelliformis TaxID=2512241 RepID=A0A553HW46_9PEZI|nr:hypothetical protein FHL15_007048 [Xylaria flabelliformis]